MLPCRQTSSILANKLQYLNLDDTRSTSKGLRVLCEKVDFHRTGAYHHHNNRFCIYVSPFLLSESAYDETEIVTLPKVGAASMEHTKSVPKSQLPLMKSA